MVWIYCPSLMHNFNSGWMLWTRRRAAWKTQISPTNCSPVARLKVVTLWKARGLLPSDNPFSKRIFSLIPTPAPGGCVLADWWKGLWIWQASDVLQQPSGRFDIASSPLLLYSSFNSLPEHCSGSSWGGGELEIKIRYRLSSATCSFSFNKLFYYQLCSVNVENLTCT